MTISKEILDDLASRFLTNLPAEEVQDPVRICFQAEKAHWFYSDFYTNSASSPKCNVRDFIRQIFKHCSFLRQHVSDIDGIIERWMVYRSEIPTHGAALLDESLENVLLVQGYHSKASWGFPKGKCNEEEAPHQCAIREVKEETGFDITELIDEKVYLERPHAETSNRLYVIEGVPHDYPFKPMTRNEIKECRWFPLDTLPCNKADSFKYDLGMYNFYMVYPYVQQLRKLVAQRRRKHSGNRKQSTTPLLNGDHHRKVQQHSLSEDQQGRRNHSRRTRSISNSSPAYYGAGMMTENCRPSNAIGIDSDKHQSSSKRSTLKRNKKPTCKQKLEYDHSFGEQSSAAAGEPSSVAESSVESLLGIPIKGPPASRKLDVRPSRAWQQFKFNWEAIAASM